MGVEDPFDLEPVLLDIGKDGVGVTGRSRARLLVEIENWIDDRTRPRLRIGDDVLDREGAVVEETLHKRLGCGHENRSSVKKCVFVKL
jgi:hypothetical protein